MKGRICDESFPLAPFPVRLFIVLGGFAPLAVKLFTRKKNGGPILLTPGRRFLPVAESLPLPTSTFALPLLAASCLTSLVLVNRSRQARVDLVTAHRLMLDQERGQSVERGAVRLEQPAALALQALDDLACLGDSLRMDARPSFAVGQSRVAERPDIAAEAELGHHPVRE